MNRFQLIIKYLKNDRVKDYEEILNFAVKNNYELISLRDYIEKKYDNSKKFLILRHDIDHYSNGAAMMFEIEKKYEATASYYFRNFTIDADFIKRIEKYGSEATLHFETIADFVKEHNIKTKEELFKINFKEKCLENLKINLSKFRNSFKSPCITIASHGEYENTLVQTPNNYLTEDTSVYNYLGIKLEAYNKNFIDSLDCYISDTVMEINNGFRYGLHPIEAIEKGRKNILFLTHPNHWHYSKYKQFKKIVKMIIKKPIIKTDMFKRI